MNCEVYEVRKEQLGKKLGQIYTGIRDHNYKYLVKGYLDGEIPILVETDICPDLWDKICDGTLSQTEMAKLRLQKLI